MIGGGGQRQAHPGARSREWPLPLRSGWARGPHPAQILGRGLPFRARSSRLYAATPRVGEPLALG